MPLKLTDLPTEILYLIIFSVDNAKDLRHLSSTNHLFKALSGPHTITSDLWFKRYSRDMPQEDLLRVANEWKFPLETGFAKSLITINAPPEPPGLSADPPGPKRALRRQERVLHIVERFGLFLHNMLTIGYCYSHDWDALQKVADDVEQYLEDLGWVQFYRGQVDRGIDSIMVSTVKSDQEFEGIAFDDFTKRLKTDIAVLSNIKISSSSNNNQLNFFSLQQYIMNKFKPPSKWQLAEYLSVVLFGNI